MSVYDLFGTRPPNNTPRLKRKRQRRSAWPWKQEGDDFFVCHPTKGWRRVRRSAFYIEATQLPRFQRYLNFLATLKRHGARP